MGFVQNMKRVQNWTSFIFGTVYILCCTLPNKLNEAMYTTVMSRKFQDLGTRGLFRIFSGSNYREVDIKVLTPQR